MTKSLPRALVFAFLLCSSSTIARAAVLQSYLTGLSSPVFLTHAGDGTDRVFVVQQAGRILVVQPGSTTPTVFLDLSARVLASSEQGLLGLAFHPLYAANGRFFVNYTRKGDGATVIAEYHVSADPNVADATEAILLTVAQPFANHNGGMLAFGPDGYLYVGMGDGGSGNDPGNRAQNINLLLGKILRLDVQVSGTYSSPPSNPFSGPTAGADEIYAVGMRNPWRFSFDRLTGTLWVGDVGQGGWEEVDTVTLGGNYGWRVFEGTHCTGLDASLCDDGGYIDPVFEYGHTGGRCSITGGYVYRGGAGALAAGSYVFADFCTGEIFLLGGGLLMDTSLSISSFGEDQAGEIYVVSIGGSISKLVPSGTPPTPTPTPSGTSTPAATATVARTATNTAAPSATNSSVPTPTPTSAGSCTTVEIGMTSGGQDAVVMGLNGASYPPAVSSCDTGVAVMQLAKTNHGGSTPYDVRDVLLQWNTAPSLPPGATITAASLRLRVASRTNADGRNLVAEWLDWGASCSSPDYSAAVGNTAHAGTPLNAIAPSASDADPRDFALTNLASISRVAGTPTSMRLGISGVAPSGSNALNIVAADHPTVTEPRLVIDYCTGTAPSPTPTLVPTSTSTPAPTTTGTQIPTPTPTQGGSCTTLEIGMTSGGQDAVAMGLNGSSYPPAFSSCDTGVTVMQIAKTNHLGSTPYDVRDVLLQWNTGAALPPGATITAARLRVRVVSRTSADSRSLIAEWFDWGATCNNADYNAAVGNNAHSGTPLSAIAPSANDADPRDLALTNLSSISRVAGTPTAMRLGISGGAPSGTNALTLVASDHPTVTEPRLVIDYCL